MGRNLTYGENILNNTVKLNFEQIYTGHFGLKRLNAYTITPLNYLKELDLHLELTWTFGQGIGLNHSSQNPLISITMSTENNSLPCISSNLLCTNNNMQLIIK